MVDIFKEAKEKAIPTWAKFSTDGDSAQGTLIGKIVGQVDGYGNKQIIYQLLQEDGETIINAGFGLNKKVLHKEMDLVKFGQIVGFRYKGKIQVKDKFGKPVDVKDFGVHQDPKIVNQAWLDENKGNMPEVLYVEESNEPVSEKEDVPFKSGDEVNTVTDAPDAPAVELTEADKLAAIEKLAKDKLATTDLEATKAAVMEKTGVAFIPLNYDEIIEKLKSL